MVYRMVTLIVLTIGIIPTAAFCYLYARTKTTSWRSLVVVNAFGWPLTVGGLYLWSMVFNIMNYDIRVPPTLPRWFALIVFGGLFNSLAWIQLIVFLRGGRKPHQTAG